MPKCRPICLFLQRYCFCYTRKGNNHYYKGKFLAVRTRQPVYIFTGSAHFVSYALLLHLKYVSTCMNNMYRNSFSSIYHQPSDNKNNFLVLVFWWVLLLFTQMEGKHFTVTCTRSPVLVCWTTCLTTFLTVFIYKHKSSSGEAQGNKNSLKDKQYWSWKRKA